MFFFLFAAQTLNKDKYGDIHTAHTCTGGYKEESHTHKQGVISWMWFNIEAMAVYTMGSAEETVHAHQVTYSLKMTSPAIL